MTGLTAEQYKQNLIDLTNNSGLPIGFAYYVAKDFLNTLEDAYRESLKDEAEGNNIEESVESEPGFDLGDESIDVDNINELKEIMDYETE
jgi:hypothetical protein